MPEQAVVETEPKVETTPVESETPSPSETTETQTEETQAEETGEQKTTEEQAAEPAEGETETKPKDEKAKAESREAYLKRQLDKRDKELAEARQAAETSPERQQEIQRQAQEARQTEVQEYMDTLGISQEQAVFLLRKQEEKARSIAASQVQPLTGTFYKTQFENIKRELATDPEIVDFKAIEEDVNKLAHEYEVKGQSFYMGNKEAVKSWALYTQGKKISTMIKAAEERGRKAALKDKRIEGEVGMPSTTVGGKTTGGITQADKDFAAKQFITVEKAREIRLAREKAIKEKQK